MTDDTFESAPVHPVQREREEALGKLDTCGAWAACGLEGEPGSDFTRDIRQAFASYRPGPDQYAALPARQRNAHYNRIAKAIDNIETELDEMNDIIVFEIDDASIHFEPEDEDELRALLSGDYEGLSYGGYHIYSILDHLKELKEVVAYARSSHARKRGKPKQNGTLEQTIANLANVYWKHTGKDPMTGYRFDDWSGDDKSQAYHGPFFDFLHRVFWSMYGRENPTSHVIGHAAREAFKQGKIDDAINGISPVYFPH